MTHRRNDSLYYKIRIGEFGVDSVHTQYIGKRFTRKSEGSGQAAFSPDGTKYAFWNKDDNLYLMNFDRSTGVLSDFKNLAVSDSGLIGGVSFAPNSRYLYVSSQFDLHQVDTEAANIQESIVHIGHYDGFTTPLPTPFYQMQLGPDCRIYMFPNNGVDDMHVIKHPNRQGTDCEFVQHGIQLPEYNAISLPNFPNYRLGVGPPCDSTIKTGLEDVFPRPATQIHVWPNPVKDVLNLDIEGMPGSNYTFTVVDVLGAVVLDTPLTGQPRRVDLSGKNIGAGTYSYFVREYAGGRLIGSGKLIVVR